MSRVELTASASASASRMACEAPLEPMGYIGCAASPSSVTRPKLHCATGSRSHHRKFVDFSSGLDERGDIEEGETPVIEGRCERCFVAATIPISPREFRSFAQLEFRDPVEQRFAT